jgi:transposase
MLPERAESNMPYSDDLRRKLVESWLTGEHTQIELAELFHVSLGWVEKVLRRWRESGDTAAAPFHHGRYPLVSPERVRRLVARHDDATLAELGRRLRVSAPTLCRYLQRLGLPRKKRCCMPASAILLVSSGCGRVGDKGVVV